MKHGSPKNEPKSIASAPLSGVSTGAPGRAEELLRAIIQGTAAVTGTAFFRSLVKHLAEGLNVRFAFVAECLPNLRARSRFSRTTISVKTLNTRCPARRAWKWPRAECATFPTGCRRRFLKTRG